MSGLASVWQLGPRIAAQVLGLTFSQYRPSGAGAAIVGGNLLRTLPAWITADANLQDSRPFAYGKPVGYAAIDPALTQVGDYLVGSLMSGGTVQNFFVASQDIPSPIQVVRCNRVLTIRRPADPTPGTGYYGGDATGTETTLLTSWPASVVQGTKGEKNDTRLPGDVRAPWVVILLPASVPVQIRFGDIAVDDQAEPVRYVFSNVEQTALGLRISASQEVA